MTDEPAAPGPAPMEGQGAYNRNSRVQDSGSAPAVPLFGRAAATVPLPDLPAPIIIADYGSSQGHNSFGPMTIAIRALRERTEQPISVVHTDLPGNDFSTLFQALETDPASYLRTAPDVFPSAVGRTFYEQVLPSASVTLGWCSWAVQWLSRIPASIPDQVQVAYSRDAAVRALYERQAADDWRMFLTHRSRELRPGGKLVILTMAHTADGDFGYRSILDAMYAALLDLVGAGFLSPEELDRMAIPTVGRSLSDLEAPFADGRFAGLLLEHAEVFMGIDAIWDRFEHDRDARGFGAKWAAFSRASVLPTLALGLDRGEGDARVEEFLDRTEAGMAARLAAAPGKVLIPLGLVVLHKA